MSDLIERLRRKKYTSAKPPYDRYQVNPDGQEAADEIERLQALYDREKAARYISIDEAIAEARRQAFIEAAEHLEASGEWKSVPIGPYGAATAEWDGPSVHELAAVLRAKAEETQG